MRKLHNIVLKATACIMTAALIVSCICVQIDSWWPTALCFGSSLWLGVFCYANGIFEGGEYE